MNADNDTGKVSLFVHYCKSRVCLSITRRWKDPVQSVHEIIQERIGIPSGEQELFYMDKKLSPECKLEDYIVFDGADFNLELVYKAKGRDIVKNPSHEKAWENLDDFLFLIHHIYNESDEDGQIQVLLVAIFEDYLKKMPQDNVVKAGNYIMIFLSSPALHMMIKLLKSERDNHMSYRKILIDALLKWIDDGLGQSDVHVVGAKILMKLCEAFGNSDRLYGMNNICRSYLGNMMELMSLSLDGEAPTEVALKDLVGIIRHIACDVNRGLVDSLHNGDTDERVRNGLLTQFRTDVKNFKKYLLLVKSLTRKDLDNYGKTEVDHLETLLREFISQIADFLYNIQKSMAYYNNLGCYESIVLIDQMHSVSHLFETTQNRFWSMLNRWNVSFSYLLINHGKRNIDEYEWIFRHSEVTTSSCKRHLGWLLFPEIKERGELPNMVIERSKLLEESFNHIITAEAETLAGLQLKFRNEEAVGHGVKREWFSLIRNALFDPQKEIFKACPNEPIRLFPNSASSNHIYIEFAGRVIALALMHKVHIKIVLDRILFLQMAEKKVSLEDTRDADPELYKNYNKMLEMDAKSFDNSEILAVMTFETYENGKVVELLPGGSTLTMNSSNRRLYVDLRVQHDYVKSLAAHVAHFKRGFDYVINSSRKRILFFQLLDLENFDTMLRGSAEPISVDEWKTHTVYYEYKDAAQEIEWFWMVVAEMSEEQRKNLLFFWTSVECLPVDGFLSLPTLSIHRRATVHGFPLANTCFYRLTLPPLPTLEAMRDVLYIITEKDNSRGFGLL